MSEFFNNLQKNKHKGMFISGNESNGIFKKWYSNDQLYIIIPYVNGRVHGEFKSWEYAGKLCVHFLYKNGNLIKDLLNE